MKLPPSGLEALKFSGENPQVFEKEILEAGLTMRDITEYQSLIDGRTMAAESNAPTQNKAHMTPTDKRNKMTPTQEKGNRGMPTYEKRKK